MLGEAVVIGIVAVVDDAVRIIDLDETIIAVVAIAGGFGGRAVDFDLAAAVAVGIVTVIELRDDGRALAVLDLLDARRIVVTVLGAGAIGVGPPRLQVVMKLPGILAPLLSFIDL